MTYSNEIKAAHKRAARFLLPPHESVKDRAAAKAEAVSLLGQAAEALRLAGNVDLALEAMALEHKAKA